MALYFLDPPVALTLPAAGAYGDVDVSASVPVGTTGVVLRIANAAGSDRSYGLRKNGASEDLSGDLNAGAHNWDFVGVDGSRIFELTRESTDIAAELVGWFDGGAAFPDAAIELSLGATGAYNDIDISSHTGAATATAALLLFRNLAAAAQVFARANGNTDDLKAIKDGLQPLLCPLDGAEILEAYHGSSAEKLYLRGWLTEGFTAEAAAVEQTPASANTWTDAALPAGSAGAVYWAKSTASGSSWGARKDGTALDWLANLSERAGLAIIPAAADTVELRRSTYPKLYRLGRIVATADDHSVTAGALAAAPELAGPTVTPEDDHTVSAGALQVAPELAGPAIGMAIDQRPEALLLAAWPFDPSVSATLTGTALPLGAGVFSDTDFVALGAETAVYLGDGRGGSFASQATDDPADTDFVPRLESGFQFGFRAFDGLRPSGRSTRAAGAIEILAGDGGFDPALAYAWDGRRVELYRVRFGAPFTDARLLLRGTVERLHWSEARVTLALRDLQALFDRPLVTATYGGTGGLDGDAGVKGRPVPQVYGPAVNVEGELINAALLIRQVHDRAIAEVTAVRDKGVALTFSADYSDYAALAGATVAGGSYATCLAYGLIRLGGAPAGRVTCDVRGDADGGYVETAADIARRIVTTRLGGDSLSDPAGLDTAALDALNAAQGAALAYCTAGANPAVAEALDALFTSIGGWYGFTRAGLFTGGRIAVPASPAFTLDRVNLDAGERIAAVREPPSWRERVEWGRPWVLQSGDDLAGSVASEDRERWAATRWAEWRDSSVRGTHRLARSFETFALFAYESDAQAEAERLGALWGTARDWITATVAGQVGQRWPGDVGTLDLESAGGAARFDLPKDAVVVGIDENDRTGLTTLTLVG